MDNTESQPRPNVVSYERERVTLTPEQVAQMSPAKKALLIATASGEPVIIRR